MEKGSWKEVFEVWPATLCCGATFAGMQWFASRTEALHLMTDVVSGVFSVICTALFLRFVWHPKTRFLLKSEREALAKGQSLTAGKTGIAAHATDTEWKYPYTVGQTAYAWVPWAILIVCCALWGMPVWKAHLNTLFAAMHLQDHAPGLDLFGLALAAALGDAGAAQPDHAHAADRSSRARSRRPPFSRSTGSLLPAPGFSWRRFSPASP